MKSSRRAAPEDMKLRQFERVLLAPFQLPAGAPLCSRDVEAFDLTVDKARLEALLF